jgi:hypothetical protein
MSSKKKKAEPAVESVPAVMNVAATWAPPAPPTTKANRKVILFTDAETERLEEFAKAYGVSEGAVVRTALRYYLDAAPDEQPEPDRAGDDIGTDV